MGAVMRLKYGAPTDSCSPFRASASSGKIVPRSTTKAKAAKATLLARKAASRDTGASIEPGERSLSPRQPMTAIDTATTRAKNPRIEGPIGDSVKAWTESSTPERVRNVPRMVNEKVATRSERFQTRSIPRRSWTITEWT